MQNGISDIPRPANEPVYSYGPGTPEREALVKELERLEGQTPDLPLVIGGRKVTTGQTGQCVQPHNHAHVLATYQKAGREDIAAAIDAAQAAKAGWEALDMASALDGLNTQGGRATSLTRDAQGHLHLVLAANPNKLETTWYDPSLELFHLTLDASGRRLSFTQLTETDARVAHWLPALEQWDWTRSKECCTDGLWMAYTRGLNAGGIWGDNRNALSTEVYLHRLTHS